MLEEDSDQIGERLRQAREGAGWVIDDVVFKTRIPRSVVTALEMGDFTVFSSPTYARSFLSQYSEFLKVDANKWLDALEPAFYRPDGVGFGVLESFRPEPVFRVSERPPRSSWFAAVGTLTIACGMVYLAVRGYELLERRFGGEVPSAHAQVAPESAPPEIVPPLAGTELEKEVKDSRLEDFAEPPMRATIVRDDP